jgi:hypothetical protein
MNCDWKASENFVLLLFARNITDYKIMFLVGRSGNPLYQKRKCNLSNFVGQVFAVI